MAGEIYLTKQGRNKLIDEMERLQKRKPLIQEELSRARDHGDLRENAEYHAAKESLSNLGKRIAELESKLSRAQLINNDLMDNSTVYIGATVKLKDGDGDEYEYTIVDVEEADSALGKISVQSPMSQGLLGHKAGETVKIKLPAGLMEFDILTIERK